MLEFIKQEPSYTKLKRKGFRETHIPEQFMYLLYRFGFLDRILNKIDLDDLLHGHFSKSSFDVHHIRPLTGGGDNRFRNLSLIERNFHRFLNKRCFDTILPKMKVGDKACLDIPNLTPVALYEDYAPFIMSVYQKKPANQEVLAETMQAQMVRRRWLQVCENLDPQTIKALELIKAGVEPIRLLTHHQIKKEALKLHKIKQRG